MLSQVGGFDGSTGLNSAEMFDPTSSEWVNIASMSTRRSSVGVGVVNLKLYAVSVERNHYQLLVDDTTYCICIMFLGIIYSFFACHRSEVTTVHQDSA